MDRMPPELHPEVCAYLPPKDLLNYRLDNRIFASIGAFSLFCQVAFHASFASFDRVVRLASHPFIHKQVKKIIWDANVWDIGNRGRDYDSFKQDKYEFDAYRYTQYDKKTADEQARLKKELQQGYALYRQRKSEELIVLHEMLSGSTLSSVLRRLTNLVDVHIINGDHSAFWHPTKYHSKVLPNYPGWNSDVPKPAQQELTARGEGVWENNLKSGLPAHHALKNSMTALGAHLTTLEVNHLSWKTFEVQHNIAQVAKSCPNITKLHLVVLVRVGRDDDPQDYPRECRQTMKNEVLRDFIRVLKNLTDIKLRFTHKSDVYTTAVDLADVLPNDRTSLQALYLERFETSEEHITQLLRSNAATMKSLALADIFLSLRGSWENVFRMVRDHMHIQFTHFNGFLCDSVKSDVRPDQWHSWAGMEDGWDFNMYSDDGEDEGGLELERKLTKHLVGEGKYPLSVKKKTSTMLRY